MVIERLIKPDSSLYRVISKLFTSLNKESSAIINIDDEYSEKIIEDFLANVRFVPLVEGEVAETREE